MATPIQGATGRPAPGSTHDRWLAITAWWGFLVSGPFAAILILIYMWPSRASVARRHAAVATFLWVAVAFCTYPLAEQLTRGFKATSRAQVERGVTTTPQDVFGDVTRTAVILAATSVVVALVCTIVGTIIAARAKPTDPA